MIPKVVRSVSQLLTDVRTRSPQDLSSALEEYLSRKVDIAHVDQRLPKSLLGAGAPVGFRNRLHQASEKDRASHNLQFARLLYSHSLSEHPVLSENKSTGPIACMLEPKDVRRVAVVGCGWGTGLQQLAEAGPQDFTGFTDQLSQTQLRLQLLDDAGLLHRARVVHAKTMVLTRADTFDAVYCPRVEFARNGGLVQLEKLVERLPAGGQLLACWFNCDGGWSRRTRLWRQVVTTLAPRDWGQSMSFSRLRSRARALDCWLDDVGDATPSMSTLFDAQLARWQCHEQEVCALVGEREFRTQLLLRAFALWAARERRLRYRWALLRRR